MQSGKANKAFSKKVGSSFGALKLDIAHCTCFAHYPFDPSSPNSIWMLLLRIDEAIITAKLNDISHSYKIELNRNLTQANLGDYRIIRNFVASNLK